MDDETQSETPGAQEPSADASIAVVGAGRLGTALARGLRAAGARVIGPLRRGESVRGATTVVLCVPDAAIATAARDAARDAAPGTLVGHCSGATTLDALDGVAPADRFSLHPLLAVPDGATSLVGASCAAAGGSPRALAAASALATRLGMRAFAVAEADRALYHAAASAASNYVVTLQSMAERLAELAGVAREHLLPLLLQTARQVSERGPRAALTGPIARGDAETVARQRAAVAERAAPLLPLWDALAAATRELAESRVPNAVEGA